MEPWIAAKDFIRTFAGQNHLVALADLPAKIEKGRVNICHAWEAMGIDRFIEQIRLRPVVTGQIVMVAL